MKLPVLWGTENVQVVGNRCLACDGAVGKGSKDLCQGCELRLPWNLVACPQCGEPDRGAMKASPFDTSQSASLCISCIENPPLYSRTITPLLHRGEARRWIRALKYHHSNVAGRLLAALLADAILAFTLDWPDLLVPVPSNWSRLMRRGHNPAAQIARGLHRHLGLPIHYGIQRRGAQFSQVGLSKNQREQNLRKAFSARYSLRGHHVAIIDDVVTTGSTARALAHCLTEAGAEQVQVWAATRTPWGLID